MGKHEDDLKTTISQGRWEAPHVGQLGAAVDTLNRAMSLLAESPGWEGTAAQAASETWVSLQRSFAKVADAAAEVERVNTNAGAALDRAAAAIGELPAGKVPSWIHNTVNAAEAGSMVFIPAMGVSVLASSAVDVFDNFLGNQREAKATQARSVLEQELNDYSAQLNAIPWNAVTWTVPEPQPTPVPGPVPDPTIRVGGVGGYTHSPDPTYVAPAYPGGGSSAPGGGSSAPGGGSSAPGGGSSAPGGGSSPSSPTYHGPSIDDGSVGTLPGYSGSAGGSFGAGGAGGGFGAGGAGAPGGLGSGANSGLTAGVFGGATAAGAAALRFGTGGGGMGGGFGAGGAGAGGLAGGASGTGGLLGAGGRAGGAGGPGGVAGGLAGAGSGASGTGTGTAAGARGGMMGGQPMGGGAGAGKKDKRSGLGGPIAPKINDDEAEFTPLPEGARAGGRRAAQGHSQ